MFSHQYAQEMLIDGQSREWVERLLLVLKALNSEVTRLTGKKPIISFTHQDDNKEITKKYK